jgi:membrane-associated phospholipid phosphatase
LHPAIEGQEERIKPADQQPATGTGYRGPGNFPFYVRLAVPVATLFAAVYFPVNWLTSLRTDNHRLYLDRELAIPFVPEMIYVYASLLLLLLLPAFTLTRPQLTALARALVTTLFVAAAVYLLLPADPGFDRPGHVPGYDAVYRALYALELPHNLVPSLHIASSALFILAVRNNLSSAWSRNGLVLWGILLCLSVLLIHQHHILDVISGLLLGYLAWRLVYLRPFHEH